MKDDYITTIHQHAMDTLDKGCTFPEMLEYLESLGYDKGEHGFMPKIGQIFGEMYVDSYVATRGYSQDENARYWMQSEAYYRHLDYLEMKESYRSAKTATRLAVIAIIVSAIFALIQIIIAAVTAIAK